MYPNLRQICYLSSVWGNKTQQNRKLIWCIKIYKIWFIPQQESKCISLKISLSRTKTQVTKLFLKRYNYINNLKGSYKVFSTSILNILFTKYVMSESSFFQCYAFIRCTISKDAMLATLFMNHNPIYTFILVMKPPQYFFFFLFISSLS